MADALPSNPISAKGDLSTYECFLLTEYNNIAQAHFHTKSSIATFFKHYLLIVSLPISIFMIFLEKKDKILTTDYINNILGILPAIFIIISVVGLLVMLYIINLDFDSLLYARTVNGIRGYFTSRSNLNNDDLLNILTLPIDINKPKYTGLHSILLVVLAFSIINTAYLFLALQILNYYYIILLSGIFFIFHIAIYIIYAFHLQHKHLSLRQLPQFPPS